MRKIILILLLIPIVLPSCGDSDTSQNPPQDQPNRDLLEITRAQIGQNDHPLLLYAASLCGLANRHKPHIFMHSGGFYNKYIDLMKSEGYTFTPATLDRINETFLGLAKGYILVDDDCRNNYIAATLAGAHDAVILTASLAAQPPYNTLTQLFDVSDTGVYDEKWLADYIEANRKLFNLTAIVNTQSYPFTMVDFVVANRYPMCSGRTSDGVQLKRLYYLVEPNSPRYGWGVPMSDEKQHVIFAAANNGLYTVPGINTLGLSVMSSKQLQPLPPANRQHDIPSRTNVHYVTLTFSDGDNTTYMLDLFSRETFLAHPRINDIPVSWMYPPTLRTNMVPVHNWYQRKLPFSNSYIASLTGPGYTMLTHHEHVADYLAAANRLNNDCGLKYMVLMDDAGQFDSDAPASFKTFFSDKLRHIPDARGFLYCNYYGYARWKGACFFVGDVPVVSLRYRMADQDSAVDPPNTLDGIAAQINAASRDVTSIDAYSAVMIQVNPGLTYEDALALKNKLDRDVVIVNADQFFELIRRNVAR